MAASAVLQLLREQNDRAELEAAFLREKFEADQERAGQQGIQLLQSGAKLKDVEAAVGGRAGEQHRALWRIIDTTKKRREQEAEAQAEGAAEGAQAQSQLAQLLRNTGGNTAAIDPALLDQIRLGLMAGGDPTPGAFIERQAAVERANAQAANQSRIAAFQEFLAKEQFKSEMRTRESLSLDSAKRSRDAEDELRKRSISHYAGLLADSQIAENEMPEGTRERVLSTIVQSMPGNASLNRALLELEADSIVRSAQDERGVAAEMAGRTGLRFPRATSKAVIDGIAVVDQFSGLPLRAKTSGDRQKIASAGAAMDALARAKAIAQKIAAGNKGGGFVGEVFVSPTARYFGVGMDDPDLNEYSAARDQLGEMLTYALTGAQAAQQQIDRILGFMPKVTELERDPKTGGLTPNAVRRIGSAYRLTEALLSAGSMADPTATRAAIQRAFDERVKGYSIGDEAAKTPPVRDPRLPQIARPR